MVATSLAAGASLEKKPVNKWAVAVAVATGALLEIIDTSIVNVALTDIQAAVGATLAQVSWVVSSYAVANVIVLPLSTWLGRRFGQKNYFVFSLIGFTVASVLCGLSTNLPMLIAGRTLQGLMGGGLLAKAQAILFETFPREEQAAAQGFFGIIVVAGPAIGPTLGGWIVTNIDWRWIFFVNLPVGIAAVIACIAALPRDEGTRDRSRVDWLAILLLAMGLGAMQTVLEEGNSDDWFESNFIVISTLLAAFGLISFVWRELTSDVPVVDLRVLRHRSLWAGSLLSVVMGMALYGALFAVPVFAQGIMQMTPEQTGFMLLPSAFASAVGMQVISRVMGKADPRMLLVAGSLGLCTALIWLGDLTPQTGEDDLFWPLIVRSFATVAMYLPLNLASLGPLPKKDISSASAFFNLTRQLGGSVGVALLTTLVDRREAFHRAVLVEKLLPGDQDVSARLTMFAQRFSSLGSSAYEAQQKALAMLDSMVNQQAAVMSFADTFWATALLVVTTLPLVMLLGKPARGVQVDAGH